MISNFYPMFPSTKFSFKIFIRHLSVNTMHTDLLLDANFLLRSLHHHELYM